MTSACVRIQEALHEPIVHHVLRSGYRLQFLPVWWENGGVMFLAFASGVFVGALAMMAIAIARDLMEK